MSNADPPRRKAVRDQAPSAPAPAQADYRFGSLESLAGFALRCMHQYVSAGLGGVLEKEGLKSHQFTALSLVVDNPGISQRDLAQALGIKPSNMVPLIDELESRGLVKRNAAATNRRSYALTAARQGQQVRDRAVALIAAHEGELLQFLDPDELAFLKSLTRRINALPRP